MDLLIYDKTRRCMFEYAPGMPGFEEMRQKVAVEPAFQGRKTYMKASFDSSGVCTVYPTTATSWCSLRDGLSSPQLSTCHHGRICHHHCQHGKPYCNCYSFYSSAASLESFLYSLKSMVAEARFTSLADAPFENSLYTLLASDSSRKYGFRTSSAKRTSYTLEILQTIQYPA